MENVEAKVEETKSQETGVETQTTEKTEGVVDVKAEAQKIADAIVARKLKDMPSKEEQAEFKAYKEAQKTETERQAEVLKKLQERETEALALKQENIILKRGVKADDVDYVLFKVSKMEGEFNDNLENFLKDNEKYIAPEKTTTTTGVKTQSGEGKSNSVSDILKAKYPNLYN